MDAPTWLQWGQSLPPLAKFAIGMAIIVGIPPLSRRAGIPPVVGLLLCGVVFGPHVLDIFGERRPIADFFADLGKLLAMFVAGLDMDLAHLRQVHQRSIIFGILTTGFPLALGTLVGLAFGYSFLAAIVMGSVLASHTLLGMPIIAQLGAGRLEPIVVTVGATVLSDTLSLIVFAVAVSTFQNGFSPGGLAVQLVEIALFVPFILFGLSRDGTYLLARAEGDEDVYFVLMFGLMATAGVIAGAINLPAIVGAFLAGLAVNAAVHDQPAKEKLEFFGKSLFIPIFFAATGFLIDPVEFAHSIVDNSSLVAAVIIAFGAGKFIAAEIAGRAFAYSRAARLTMWSLSLPQVAATLAATLVAYDTRNAAGARLLNDRMLHVVLVLVVTTAIIGPALTQRFATRLRVSAAPRRE